MPVQGGDSVHAAGSVAALRSAHKAKRVYCPLIIGQVVPNKDETSRSRMLLQGGAIARCGNFLLDRPDPKHPFILQAIHLTGDYIAQRFLICAETKLPDDGSLPRVYITRDEFDVKTQNGTLNFLKEMLNYGDYIQELCGRWNPSKFDFLASLNKIISKLPSVSADIRIPDERSKGESRGAGRRAPAQTVLDILEPTLTQFGYEVRRNVSNHHHVYHAFHPEKGPVVLKSVRKA
ncbi:hypothetical protein BOTBODRAFT_610919 [Botryobasidium botryosum FD-172 SS1]|uniref:Uncharacterized protein n=1 Tax=Botryobasidium botryosum (strain FD-172 SS1) TaxID=930990 RepID=A0A067M708_BOTB1|nr:hypothetical protein BOTBODRAFT_610919 [Botryobasidium botryosum FD-172 SS1]